MTVNVPRHAKPIAPQLQERECGLAFELAIATDLHLRGLSDAGYEHERLTSLAYRISSKDVLYYVTALIRELFKQERYVEAFQHAGRTDIPGLTPEIVAEALKGL